MGGRTSDAIRMSPPSPITYREALQSAPITEVSQKSSQERKHVDASHLEAYAFRSE